MYVLYLVVIVQNYYFSGKVKKWCTPHFFNLQIQISISLDILAICDVTLNMLTSLQINTIWQSYLTNLDTDLCLVDPTYSGTSYKDIVIT